MKRWIAVFCGLFMTLVASLAFADTWICPNCGNENNGKFCSECGTAATVTWVCTGCTTENSGKYCTECGLPRLDASSAVNVEANFRTGDTVVFGHYEQDNNTTNGKEPIEWIVINTDPSSGICMLLSRYALDSIPYGSGECTWETSSIRAWLNSHFIQEAFSSGEQEAISTTLIDNSASQGDTRFLTNGGNNTNDKVFLLSCFEVTQYLQSEDLRRAAGTKYAVNRGAYRSDGYIDWWLRSPGSLQNSAARVCAGGWTSDYFVSNNERAVRPALWVNNNILVRVESSTENDIFADAEYQTDEEIAAQQQEANERLSYLFSSAPHVTEAEFSNVNIGDCLWIGHYEQDGNTDNGSEPIEWLVLDKKDGKLLIITKHIIERKRYNESFVPMTWADCSLRQWLNGRFFMLAFNTEEQELICLTSVDNSQQQQGSNDTTGGNNTNDYLFALSWVESQYYFDNNESRQCSATPYVKDEGISVSDGSWLGGKGNSAWWLRSPGIKDQSYVLLIESSGTRDSCGVQGNYGVRPAMWVKMKNQ